MCVLRRASPFFGIYLCESLQVFVEGHDPGLPAGSWELCLGAKDVSHAGRQQVSHSPSKAYEAHNAQILAGSESGCELLGTRIYEQSCTCWSGLAQRQVFLPGMSNHVGQHTWQECGCQVCTRIAVWEALSGSRLTCLLLINF